MVGLNACALSDVFDEQRPVFRGVGEGYGG